MDKCECKKYSCDNLVFISRFMKTREPFQLKNFLAIYNIIQVTFCVYFLINAFNAGFKIDYLWKCYLPGYENVAHAKLLYLTYFIKAFEFTETICFILRRNFRQVSFLHVYHHVSTFIFAYIGFTLVGSMNENIFSVFLVFKQTNKNKYSICAFQMGWL